MHVKFYVLLIFLILISPVYAQNYDVNLDLNMNSVKMCPCSTTQIIGTLENKGTDENGYSIESDSEWVTIAPNKVTLGPKEKETIYIYLTPSCDAVPENYQIKIMVDGESSDKEIIDLDLLNCHGVEIIVDSLSKSDCFDEFVIFDISIKNTGKEAESFNLESSLGTLSQNILEIESMERKTAELTVAVLKEKEDVTLSVKSQDIYSYAQDSKVLEVIGLECMDVEISLYPLEKEVCEREVAEFTINVKNTGKRNDTFMISSNLGDFVDREVSLEAGEERDVILKILTETIETKDYDFTVTVESEEISDSIDGKLRVKDIDTCYGFEVSAEPEMMVINTIKGCLYTINLKNTGDLAAEYNITAEGPEWSYVDPKNIILESSEEKEIYVYMSPPFGLEEGNYTTKVEIESDKGFSKTQILQLLYGETLEEEVIEEEVMEEITGEVVDEGGVFEIEIEEEKRIPNKLILALLGGIILIILIIFGPKLLEKKPEEEKPKKKSGRKKKKKGKKEEEIEEVLENI